MRVYLRRRSGFRGPRGGPVFELQNALNSSGGAVWLDGVFGRQTEDAIKAWQSGSGLPQTGFVDEAVWTGVVSDDLPSVFRRCLGVTAAFEGHGYTFAAGNWDNAYVTWGIVGFTLKHGNLGGVIRSVEASHPGLIATAIGDDKAAELLAVIEGSDAEKRAWAEEISVKPRKYHVVADWAAAFDALGRLAEVQLVQDQVARDVYWTKAVQDLEEFGAMTELDAALFFDTAVQNGGVNGVKAAAIRAALAANPGVPNRARLRLIADAIAENSNPDFVEDVRSRRRCIADGQGRVHGADYFTADWGIDEAILEAGDLER